MVEDNFIGSTFPTPKGGTLTVVGWNGERDSGGKKYILTCSLCSEDKELFPERCILSNKGNLVKGQTPCGCAKRVSWSREQWIVKINRLLLSYGYQLIHIPDGKLTNRIRVCVFNPETGNIWTPTIDSLMSGVKDPLLTYQKVSETHRAKYNYVEVLQGLNLNNGNYKFKDNCIFYKVKPFARFTCNLCSKDSFVENGLCDGVFKAEVHNLINYRHVPCRCSTSYRYTKEQREYQLSLLCKSEGLTFIGWPDGYKNSKSVFRWSCKLGNVHDTILNSFISQGNRCNCCRINTNCNGFYTDKVEEKDYLYIIDLGDILKTGRSFNVTRRFRDIEKISGRDVKMLHIFKGKHEDVYNIEQETLRWLKAEGLRCYRSWSTELFVHKAYLDVLHKYRENKLITEEF